MFKAAALLSVALVVCVSHGYNSGSILAVVEQLDYTGPYFRASYSLIDPNTGAITKQTPAFEHSGQAMALYDVSNERFVTLSWVELDGTMQIWDRSLTELYSLPPEKLPWMYDIQNWRNGGYVGITVDSKIDPTSPPLRWFSHFIVDPTTGLFSKNLYKAGLIGYQSYVNASALDSDGGYYYALVNTFPKDKIPTQTMVIVNINEPGGEHRVCKILGSVSTTIKFITWSDHDQTLYAIQTQSGGTGPELYYWNNTECQFRSGRLGQIAPYTSGPIVSGENGGVYMFVRNDDWYTTKQYLWELWTADLRASPPFQRKVVTYPADVGFFSATYAAPPAAFFNATTTTAV